jgi:flagellar L-ring protein precursor FlgH
MTHRLTRYIVLSLSLHLLAGCASTIDRLEAAGDPPPLKRVSDPVADAGYQPMTWPLPEQPLHEKQYAGSLWQPGSRHFFRDQRASRIGDILRVNVNISDRASLNNNTTRGRNSTESVATPNLFGIEAGLFGILPGDQDPDTLLGITSDSNNKGTGRIQRQEQINTQVAATVVQVLPNGNLVIEGSQEVLVNYDIRELGVGGVIRPEDIKADNTIDSNQIAQARITYSGRGTISDVHRPRWGTQVIDILSPF